MSLETALNGVVDKCGIVVSVVPSQYEDLQFESQTEFSKKEKVVEDE